MHHPCCSPRTSRAIKKNVVNYILPGLVRDDGIKVFDVNGRYLRTIGRKGAGPGELDGASAIDLCKEELIVYCFNQARLTYFDGQGNLIKTRPAIQE